jgi:VanZ family protein
VKYLLWAPVVIYMALIFTLSSVSHPPDLPSGISDGTGHAILYFGLGALVVRAIAGGWSRSVTIGTAMAAAAISALYGVTDEVHQHFVPPRRMEALDLVADTIGAAVAAFGLYARSRAAEANRRRDRAAEAPRGRGV